MELRKIRTALLSYGMSGEVFHGPLLKAHPGFEVVAVYQRNMSRKPAHQFPVTNQVDDILNDKNIELVIVNTPNDSHFEYTAQALRAGKHVVVEKPFTVTAKEADELIELAADKKLMLSVFQNRRWDGGFLTIEKIIKSEMLGRLVEAEFHYDRFRNVVDPQSWKESPKPGIGIHYNLGSHMIDQVLMLFGVPKEVDARMGSQRTGASAPDYYDIRFSYPSGLNVIIKSSYLVREPGPMYRLNGTDGSFVKFGIDPQEEDLKEGKIPGGAVWGREPLAFWGKINTTYQGLHFEGKIETLPGNYLEYYSNIFDAIRHNAALVVTPQQARTVIAIIEACIESSVNRRAVKVS